MKEIAFVGDIHGSIDALNGILEILQERHVDHIVFLGDYINKGLASNAVLSRLISLGQRNSVTLLRGNHETALLDAIESRNLTGFLKLGGAATIRSYIGGDSGPDVLREFRNAIPNEHLDTLRAMPTQFLTTQVIAQHQPSNSRQLFRTGKFSVTAHRPVGPRPVIRRKSAEIDTGCGDGGLLTSFLWPSREYVQVNSFGIQA